MSAATRRCCRALGLLLALLPALAHAEWYRREEAIMGTRIYVELWADAAPAGESAVAAVI